MRRGLSWGELFLANVHSQMNPQTCTEFGANRPIRLAAFPDLNLWPPKTPSGIEGRIVFSYVHSQTNPQTCTKFVVPISPVVWQLPKTFEFVTPPPPRTPWGIQGRIAFSLCPFPDESADVYHIWCQPVQPFDSIPKHLNVWPPNPFKSMVAYWCRR